MRGYYITSIRISTQIWLEGDDEIGIFSVARIEKVIK